MKSNLPHLNFDFQHFFIIPSEIGKNCWEIKMRPIPPHPPPMESGHKSKLKVVLAVERRETFFNLT